MKIQTTFNFATVFYDNYLNKAPSTLRRRNLKTEFSPWKRIKSFPPTLRRRNFKTQQITRHFGFVFEKTTTTTTTTTTLGQGNHGHDYCEVIVFKKLRCQVCFLPHGNEKSAFSHSCSLKSVLRKFRFRDGLVWTVSLAVEIKLGFQIPRRSVDAAWVIPLFETTVE